MIPATKMTIFVSSLARISLQATATKATSPTPPLPLSLSRLRRSLPSLNYCGGSVSWKASFQKSISHSSTESELVALDEAPVAGAIWSEGVSVRGGSWQPK